MDQLHDHAIDAAIRFIERKDMEVIESRWRLGESDHALDIIAKDKNGIIFFDVTAVTVSDEGFSKGNLTREQFEFNAAMWLAQQDLGEVPIRFDRIDMIVVGEDRAMLRHHINALREGSAE